VKNIQISNTAASIGESPTLAIDAKYKNMLAAGVDVLGFCAGEPDFDTPEHIRQAAIDAINSGFTRYTAVSGDLTLRNAICEKFKTDNGLEYKPDQIVVSNGAKQSLLNAFTAIVNHGDEVIIPTPYWVSYPEMVKLVGGIPKMLMTTEQSGYKLTVEMLRKAITPQTKAIVLNSPSNPLGIIYSQEELQALADFAVRKGLYVISDEVYEKIIFDKAKHISIASLSPEIKELTITVNGVSKSHCMTGWRIGYTASNSKLAKAMANIQSHSTSNPCSISQRAAYAALTGPQDETIKMCKTFEERRDFLMKHLDEIPIISYIKPQGAFYLMLNVSRLQKLGESTDDFCQRLLDEAKIALVSGSSFGMEGFVRWSFSTGLENIENGFKRLKTFVKK